MDLCEVRYIFRMATRRRTQVKGELERGIPIGICRLLEDSLGLLINHSMGVGLAGLT